MTNAEKYKTAREQALAFDRFCEKRLDKVAACAKCELQMTHYDARTGSVCPIAWLDLEAEEEKPLPCPFCGGECSTVKNMQGQYVVGCDGCYYSSQDFASSHDAIAAHNRVAKAVMDAKKEQANGKKL